MAEVKRIYKMSQGRIVDGVCGGFAHYLGVDAVWVRIGWVILSLAGGIGILAYLLGMYFFPRMGPDQDQDQIPSRKLSGTLIAGVLLFAAGILIVLRALGILRYGFWGAWDVAWVVLWPLCLIGGGLFLLFVYWRESTRGQKGLRRSPGEKVIMGVCAGLGEYFRTDPSLVRFIFALLIILSRGVGLLVYLVIALLTPESKEDVRAE